MTRRVKAPGYKILVRLKPIELKTETRTAGGIICKINTSEDLRLEQESMTEGYVMDIGEMAFKDCSEPWCKVGDCVLIYKHSGVVLSNMDDTYTYRIIQDLDIQAVFPDEGLNNDR